MNPQMTRLAATAMWFLAAATINGQPVPDDERNELAKRITAAPLFTAGMRQQVRNLGGDLWPGLSSNDPGWMMALLWSKYRTAVTQPLKYRRDAWMTGDIVNNPQLFREFLAQVSSELVGLGQVGTKALASLGLPPQSGLNTLDDAELARIGNNIFDPLIWSKAFQPLTIARQQNGDIQLAVTANLDDMRKFGVMGDRAQLMGGALNRKNDRVGSVQFEIWATELAHLDHFHAQWIDGRVLTREDKPRLTDDELDHRCKVVRDQILRQCLNPEISLAQILKMFPGDVKFLEGVAELLRTDIGKEERKAWRHRDDAKLVLARSRYEYTVHQKTAAVHAPNDIVGEDTKNPASPSSMGPTARTSARNGDEISLFENRSAADLNTEFLQYAFGRTPEQCGVDGLPQRSGSVVVEPPDKLVLFFSDEALRAVTKSYLGDNVGYTSAILKMFGAPVPGSVWQYQRQNLSGRISSCIEVIYSYANCYASVVEWSGPREGVFLNVCDRGFMDEILRENLRETEALLTLLKNSIDKLVEAPDWNTFDFPRRIACTLNVTGENRRTIGSFRVTASFEKNLFAGFVYMDPILLHQLYAESYVLRAVESPAQLWTKSFPIAVNTILYYAQIRKAQGIFPPDSGGLEFGTETTMGIVPTSWQTRDGLRVMRDKYGDFVVLKKISKQRDL